MQSDAQLNQVIDRLPTGRFVMTAVHGDDRAGVIVKSVQACADEPLLISVAIRKGHTIEPLIRDSHAFAICWVEDDDRLSLRTFARDAAVEPDAEERPDPFAAFAVETLATGAPVLKHAKLVLDCEVVRHFDLEADHELYIGQVVAARVAESGDASGMGGSANGSANGSSGGSTNGSSNGMPHGSA